MAIPTIHPRITRLSLPAEPYAFSVLHRFIREIARGANLSMDEITNLQIAVTKGFNNALMQRNSTGQGCIALQVEARADEIKVDIAYQRFSFIPPEEFFLPS